MTQLNSRKSIHNPTSTINKNTQWINNVTYWGGKLQLFKPRGNKHYSLCILNTY